MHYQASINHLPSQYKALAAYCITDHILDSLTVGMAICALGEPDYGLSAGQHAVLPEGKGKGTAIANTICSYIWRVGPTELAWMVGRLNTKMAY